MRLETIPSIGIIGGTATATTVTMRQCFDRFRGLDRTDATTELDEEQAEARADMQAGRPYLRRILVVGAHATLQRAMQNPDKYPWPRP